PTETSEFERVEPMYVELPGWQEDLRSARSLNDLPQAARNYLTFMEDFTGVQIAILSIGPDREETMVLKPDLIWNEASRAPHLVA
ncbi:MAG: adenylosuccinate synthase, partial [Fimbriimonadaceae bacterium]|nr:adenylosuccinate synthase [Fimbriimonadaceae bacterium]